MIPKKDDTAKIGTEFAMVYRFSWESDDGKPMIKVFVCVDEKDIKKLPMKEYMKKKNFSCVAYADVVEDKIVSTFFDQRLKVDREK